MDYKKLIEEEEKAKNNINQLRQSIKDKFKEDVNVFIEKNCIEVVLTCESINKPLSWFNKLLEDIESKSLEINVIPKVKTGSHYVPGKTEYNHAGIFYGEGRHLTIFKSVSLELTLKFRI